MTSPKNLLSDSIYIADVIMWPKFGNFSMSMRGVIIASILEVLLVELQWFVAGTKYGLVILYQCRKRVKFKSQKVFVANPYVCRSYRGSTGRGGGFLPPSPSWIGLIYTVDVVLESFLFTLNRFHPDLFWCFYCWLWTVVGWVDCCWLYS